MGHEKRELLLAGGLGLLAGPCYLVAGPERFLTWYAVILGGGIFSTAHWLRDLKPSRPVRFWLAWPVVMTAGAGLSMFVCMFLQKLF